VTSSFCHYKNIESEYIGSLHYGHAGNKLSSDLTSCMMRMKRVRRIQPTHETMTSMLAEVRDGGVVEKCRKCANRNKAPPSHFPKHFRSGVRVCVCVCVCVCVGGKGVNVSRPSACKIK